jgi:hypothetical protein
MEEPEPRLEPQLEGQEVPTMSLGSRLMNVFATPGDVFAEVKATPPSSTNWLVPALILILVSWLATGLIFSQDAIKHQISDITDQAIQKRIAAAHMNEQQAEQARAIGEKWAVISSKIGAVVSPVLYAFIAPFFWGLILWLVGAKFLRAGFGYMKAVEVVGLANMIEVLDTVVRTLLVVGLGNLYASPSLLLFVKDFDPQNPVNGLLGAVNLMTFWLLAVRAVGLARLSGMSWAKAAMWVFGIWAAYTGFFIGLGAVAQQVFKRMGA